MTAYKAVLLLAAAMLLASAAAEKARLLEDTWSQDYYGGKPSAAHSSHQPAEVLTTCLRETAFKNCRPRLNNIDAVSYFESQLTCCSDLHDGSNDAFSESDIEIGSCAFDTTWWDDEPIIVSATASKIGTFIATCTLKNAASLCGTPFCEQMVLTAQGAIYETRNVVSYVEPVAPMADASCDPVANRSSQSSGRPHSKRIAKGPAGNKKVATASAEDDGKAKPEYYSNHAPHMVYKGTATIFSGPMSLHSRYYDVKWQGAHMEYVYDFVDAESIDEEEAHGHYVVEPFAYKLTFTRSKGQY